MDPPVYLWSYADSLNSENSLIVVRIFSSLKIIVTCKQAVFKSGKTCLRIKSNNFHNQRYTPVVGLYPAHDQTNTNLNPFSARQLFISKH